MSYKVNCTSDGDGFLLTYGKGLKKLVAHVRRDPKGFHTSDPVFSGKLREVKEQWGVWAEAKYAGGGVMQSPPVDAPEIAGSNPALPIVQERPESVLIVRQQEIDHAATQDESDDWFRHVTVLEEKRAQREPGYKPHVYRKRGQPPRRNV